MKRAVQVLFGLVACAFVPGCATETDSVTPPSLPKWIQPSNAQPVPALRVVAEIHAIAPGAAVSFADNSYILVSRKWLDEYVAWTWSAAKAADITYTAESWDCDEFADAFALMASLAAAQAGVKAKPLVARLVVQWDGTMRHAVCGVATDAGNVIVEPQPTAGPFRVWPIADYPHRILAVALGDKNP